MKIISIKINTKDIKAGWKKFVKFLKNAIPSIITFIGGVIVGIVVGGLVF